MNFEVVFLGTGAAVPVPSRGTTSQFVDIHGHTYLVDAGEGVQLALRKNKRKFQKLKGVFISHMHGDHVLGLPGLLSTMSLLGAGNRPLPVWGPEPLGPWLDATWHAIQAHMSFEVEFKPWGDDAVGSPCMKVNATGLCVPLPSTESPQGRCASRSTAFHGNWTASKPSQLACLFTYVKR